MSNFFFGLFIGLIVGGNIGVIALVMHNSGRTIVAQAQKNPANQVKRDNNPFIETAAHSCPYCCHEWREYSILNIPPKHCPSCGASLILREKQSA